MPGSKHYDDKVNSLLVALDMNGTLDGMLPHASVLCILRYTPAGAVHDGVKELNKTVDRNEEDGAFHQGLQVHHKDQ